MSAKVAWMVAALVGLVWVRGVAMVWLAGTPKLRLSVAPGALGVVRGEHRLEACATGRGKEAGGVVRGDETHGTYGTNGTDRSGLRITRHVPASRITRQEDGEGARAEGGPMGASAPLGMGGSRRKCGKCAGVPPFFFKKGGGAGSRRTYGVAAVAGRVGEGLGGLGQAPRAGRPC